MNYACEITYPVDENINGSIMASFPQLLAICLTFLCDYFIDDHKDKKWASNVLLIILLLLSIIFTFLLDEKLDRQEIEQNGRLKEKNENEGNKNKLTADVVEVKNNEKNG